MKKITFFLSGLMLVLAAGLSVVNIHRASAGDRANYFPGEVLVKFKDGTVDSDIVRAHSLVGGRVKETIPGIDVQVVAVKRAVGEAVSAYAKNRQVEYVEPNYTANALIVPNDAYFDRQWGLHNTGQNGGLPDADIDAPEAWDLTTGNNTVKIAVLDSGIDQDHEDLAAKVMDNVDFTSSGTDDRYGHGTHVAGIAAATTNNGLGVAGAGYQSVLMNVKVLNDSGVGAYSWIAGGIVWAADHGAKVINMSLGGSRSAKTLENAVNYAWDKGVLITAAAGNSGNASRTYPAYYSHCIAVAATDSDDVKASFSSYGSWVDVAAPGVNIYSTFPNHQYAINKSLNYDYGSGTSMSTPMVSGTAALVWAIDASAGNQTVRDKIEQGADPIAGTGSYWHWGRVNACNAVGGNCSSAGPAPTSTPEPSPEPSPSPQPADCSYCFKKVCDNRCHPTRETALCPDCW